MYTETVIIPNKTGLHARPASDLVEFCKQFSSLIELLSDRKTINAKSIISLLSGGLKQYTEVQVRATGEDEAAAGPAVAGYIRALRD
ncbi:HPr family phosphocarrier protein [Pseudoflavonifractor sp. BIOML-A6]|nr:MULTISPECIES: HPr family phosphocarrier protein [unclassified Pseudoflavonifractor]MTQ96859.1 HPr family phosphocarrier protein [Pseudoflavonifractor sp. BIOML-A16]MTR05048.1 HPr family phosphocarrier protein [Pseudoflavonifractor sp. BIOML-A15]MTR32669.1 HPr family phosphocarrier protein [Pseudoflavonifractor sp. BIOML-A14]MTR72063.1 HPr family phosphocarrier protein [Pseudoflavonifractor sp. BIOML-A18]MTS65111.1 HPr family phosphocarrier protein [Pseudoflavonifractor sp. BIOML-A5]MTS7040